MSGGWHVGGDILRWLFNAPWASGCHMRQILRHIHGVLISLQVLSYAVATAPCDFAAWKPATAATTDLRKYVAVHVFWSYESSSSAVLLRWSPGGGREMLFCGGCPFLSTRHDSFLSSCRYLRWAVDDFPLHVKGLEASRCSSRCLPQGSPSGRSSTCRILQACSIMHICAPSSPLHGLLKGRL